MLTTVQGVTSQKSIILINNFYSANSGIVLKATDKFSKWKYLLLISTYLNINKITYPLKLF